MEASATTDPAPVSGAGTPDTALARVGVAVVNYNAGPWLGRCVAALRPGDSQHPEIVIVDHGSVDDSLTEVERLALPGVSIVRTGDNPGFAAGVNRAAAQLDDEFVLVVNPDCAIGPEDLARLVAELDAHPEAALVSGRVVGLDGREQRASRRRRPTPGRIIAEWLPGAGGGIDLTDTPPPETAVEVEAVSGACMLVRSAVLAELGGLDERYRLHFEDLDLFARLEQAGWTLRWVPDVRIVHAAGYSSQHRPAGAQIDKHRGLWRYLTGHCADQWPHWQRPLWAAAVLFHLALRLAMVLVRRR